MNRLTLVCLIAALGIVLGAFGAHALKDLLAENGSAESWRTAVLYHLIHAVALLAVVSRGSSLRAKWSVPLWVLGILLFSGSIYGLALTGWKLLGPITPLGGLAFIAGWILLAIENRGIQESKSE
ncbi:DUF423 domain-containing protein [Pelagicoccus sp. SDUM812003]|uniref:DUF423 domain-containing protein n=1 Tax=Pelagicoccus sp. SDUM812003 TaxID=3041267 RepID=UPI00280EFB74|nr:DUF423 domain-containing protein [Pelagicoccus sp. SDUM812003]MDQ8204200.1 DUF423 domain-containing protein [Pelagicoccus sp. SDUM812003]